MSLIEKFQYFFLGTDRQGDNTSIRQKGSSSALLDTMLAYPDAVMIVYSHAIGRQWSKEYGIDEKRFISIRDGLKHLEGRTFMGPVLVDVCAIGVILTQIRNEQDNFTNSKDATIARLKKAIGQILDKIGKIEDILEEDDIELTLDDLA